MSAAVKNAQIKRQHRQDEDIKNDPEIDLVQSLPRDWRAEFMEHIQRSIE
jgi:hypothetical protein